MNASLQSKINDLSTNGYHFDLGKYLSIAWGNFAKAPVMYILYVLLCTLIALISFILVIIPLVRIISPLFTIGFAVVANNIQKGQRIRFGNFFNGFNNSPGQLILVSLVSSLPWWV